MQGSANKLFAEAAHVHVLRRMRLVRPQDRAELRKRVGIALAVAWLPLALIGAVNLLTGQPADDGGFFLDVAVQARLLVALPILIASDYIVLPRLEAIGLHFRVCGLVSPPQMDAFSQISARARRLSAGVWPSGLVILIVYALIADLVTRLPRNLLPAWQLGAMPLGLSISGWWHSLFSLPILLGLVLAWAWRLAIWILFLAQASRLRLALRSSHPDHAGGLQFVALSPRIFAPLALAIASIVAGTMGNRALHAGISPVGHEGTPLMTAAIVVLAFASPPLLFSRALLIAWRAGVFLYGDLATRMASSFEAKWLSDNSDRDVTALEVPDFSATVDLYGVVANVYAMRVILYDVQSIVALVSFTFLPFLPVWLSVVPLSTLLHRIAGMLF